MAAVNTNGIDKKSDAPIVKTETKQPDSKATSAPANNLPKQPEKKDVAVTNTGIPVNNTGPQDTKKLPVTNSNQGEKKPDAALTKTENKPVDTKATPVNNQTSQTEKKDIAASDKKTSNDFEFQELRRNRKLKPAASLVDGRISVPSETIYFKSDSLSIALYDNGEVDGDTVSVIINDEMFIDKQGLKSSAFRKTFYVPQQDSDSLLVVLYAENLGKYPPNTGLLQIKDGEEIFYVRFKADLDRNAAIVLRRKYK